MSKKDEALKLALEAMEQWESGCGTTEYLAKVEKAVPVIREALAEQEEKPTTREEILSMAREAGIHVYPEFEGAFELFAALVAAHVRETERKPWVGLTDEEKADLFEGTAPYYNELDYANDIEAKLREKNA